MKKTGIIIFAMIVCIFAGISTTMHAHAATIDKGIYIDGIDVSGMTADEALNTVTESVNEWYGSSIKLTNADGYEVVCTPEDFGMSWSNTEIVNLAASYGNTGNVLQRYKAAKDVELNNINYDIVLDFDKNSISEVIENNDDFAKESTDIIYDYLVSSWNRESDQIELPVNEEKLAVSTDLGQSKDIIGTFTTDFKTSGASRVQNVTNGCNLINGAVLNPGEQFSVLEHILPFTAENGYALAGSYMNGLVVDTFGGGICQVSTTLYNAVLLAELQVDVRHNHSMIVDYVPASGDAAITEMSGKDFKFTNNKDFPIYIEGIITDDKKITFNIYGVETRPANRVVSFKSEVLERTVAETENIIQDPGQPIGFLSLTSSHAGIKAQYIKVVTVDGVEESSEVINKSSYKMVPRTLVVGVATSNPDAYNQLQAAIATGSIDQTRATAKALAGAAAPPPAQETAPAVQEPAPVAPEPVANEPALEEVQTQLAE